MSTLGGIKVIWAGQSNAVATTPERVATDAKYTAVAGVPAWITTRFSASSLDVRYKRTPFATMTSRKSYPLTFNSITSRNWPGAPEAAMWKLRDLGHSPHIIQFAEGGSSLAQDWDPTPGFKRDYERLTWEYTQAIASRRCPANPGSARTVLVWIQGEEDAASALFSAAYQVNWAAFIAALRTYVGIAALKVVMVKLNTGCVAANTAAVRTAMDAIDAADANVSLVSVDDLSLWDGFHYHVADAETMGLRIATAIDAVMP